MSFTTSKKTIKVGNITVIYGEGGAGKTSIISQAIKEAGDKGLFIAVGEEGLAPLQKDSSFIDLKGVNRVDDIISVWSNGENGLIELMKWLFTQEYTDIAFDSVSMIIKSLEDYCFKVYYLNDPGSHGKSSSGAVKTEVELRKKAYGFMKSELLNYMEEEWRKFIKGVQYLRNKGVNIYISSHTKTKKGRILGEDLEYDFADLDMPNNKNVCLATDLFNCSDLFLYGKKDISLAKGKQKGKGKVIGTGDRVLVCESNVIKVKNRKNMPEQIPATYEELKKYL